MKQTEGDTPGVGDRGKNKFAACKTLGLRPPDETNQNDEAIDVDVNSG